MEYIAKIDWIKPTEGGRIGDIPFNTEKYGPQIKVRTNQENWSLIVNNFKKIDNFTTLAKVHYLNIEKAPENLFVGLNFELYEGPKKVARGIIIQQI